MLIPSVVKAKAKTTLDQVKFYLFFFFIDFQI